MTTEAADRIGVPRHSSNRTRSTGVLTVETVISADQKRMTADALLAEARADLVRLAADSAQALALADAATLVDIRSDAQRAEHGLIPGATYVPRNVLEWRCDPSSSHRDPALAHRDRPIVLICQQGYQSSLAAATLRRLGLRATDVVGGFEAWSAAGLPSETGPPLAVGDERRPRQPHH